MTLVQMVSAFILSLLQIDTRPHPAEEDTLLRETLARDFIEAGEEHDLDPFDLVFWGFKESGLYPDAVGKHPNPKGKVVHEKGIPQVHGVAFRLCRDAGLDVWTYRGGSRCIALLLRRGVKTCGSLPRSRGLYMSGKCHLAKKKAAARHRVGRRKACPFRGGVWRKGKCLAE